MDKSKDAFNKVIKEIVKIVNDSNIENEKKKNAANEVIKNAAKDIKEESIQKNLIALTQVIDKIKPDDMTEDHIRKLCEEKYNKLSGIKSSSNLMNYILSFGSGALLTFLLAEGIPLLKSTGGGNS